VSCDVPLLQPSDGDYILLNPESPLARVLAAPMRAGVVTWIGLRPERRQACAAVPETDLNPEDGLVGDHGHSRTRQVTVISAEHLAAVAGYLRREALDPALVRRNVVVRGVNMHALKGRTFTLGTAVLLATGECHPCSRMEDVLGVGGYNAVRGHGGITARVLMAGQVRIGDALDVVTDPTLS
jgi:MOSC domain-containing protein YiiM